MNFAEKGLLPQNVNTTNGVQKQNLIESISKYLNEIGIKSDVVETLYGDDDEEEKEKEIIKD